MKYETYTLLNPKIQTIKELGLEGWVLAASMYDSETRLSLFYFQREIKENEVVEDTETPYEEQTVSRKAYDIRVSSNKWQREEIKRLRSERNMALRAIQHFEAGDLKACSDKIKNFYDLIDYNSRTSPVHKHFLEDADEK